MSWQRACAAIASIFLSTHPAAPANQALANSSASGGSAGLTRRQSIASLASSGVVDAPAADSASGPATPITLGSAFDPHSKLSLKELLAIADKNFPKLLAADVERRMASARRLEAQGAFDPVLSTINEYKRIQDLVVAGKPKDAIHNEHELAVMTRSGVKLFGRIRVNPNDASTPFLQSGLAGEYSGGFVFPLFRNFRINELAAAERKAKLGEPLAVQTLRLARLEVLLEASIAYWDWVAAHFKVQVAKNLLEIAEFRAQTVKDRVVRGDLPRIDISEAEQEIQLRVGNLARAQRQFQKATFKLSFFLWEPGGAPSPLPTAVNAPDELEKPGEVSDLDTEKATATALSRRPELKIIELQRQIAQVNLKLARNQLLPEINAVAYQGADTGRQGIGPVLRGGAEIQTPVAGFRSARGRIQQAQLALEKITYEQRLQEQKIKLEVQDVVSNINALHQRWLAARQELEMARVLEKGERTRFDHGDSTLFFVNRRERDRAEAENKVIDVHAELLQALATLRAATAQL